MYCYRLVLAYDGTNFSGWQIQPNASTIQEEVQNALKKFLRIEKISLVGSGRTDAGVHAKGQVAHFRHSENLDLFRLVKALNGMLPREIRILEAQLAPPYFHARYSAVGKEYHYHLHTCEVIDPFSYKFRWQQTHLNLDLLQEGARYFIGTHDFTTFSNEAHEGAASKNPVRTLFRLDLIEEVGGFRLEFEGNGFLYKMVRNIVGTLVDVAKGKKKVDEIPALFHARDRRKASLAAPAKGLFLVKVHYV